MHRPVTITRRRLVGALVRGGLLALFTGGCSVLDRGVDLLPSAPKLDVAILPTRQEEKPQPRATAVPPDSLPVAKAYLAAWSGNRYHEMYEVLAAASRAAHPQDRFVRRYQTIKEVGTIESWEAEVIGDPQPPEEPPPPDAPVTVEVPFRLRVRTSLAGEFEQENRLKLVFENGTWRVAWSPSSIFKELKDDYLVHLFPDIPPRGSILDRKGRPLATQDVVLEVGVVPGELAEEDRALGVLGDLLGSPAEAIKERYAKAEPHWWVPLREFPASEREAVTSKVKDVPGVQIREKPARVYPNGPTAAHVIGYVSRVTAEELQELAPKGYQETDVVGRAGIEGWGEKILAGERGGRLAVITSAGRVVKVLSERPSVPGNNIVLTIDVEVQRLAEEAFGDRTGSVVVLDPRDNSVLALVSSPRFDPNKFVLGFTTEEWEQLSNDPRLPFQNRPVQSAYPTGSVFKVITALTGLERGGFSPGTTFRCGGSWRGLPGVVFGDWLPGGHGTLSLVEGITQSCNIVFYEIGKRLDEIDPHILPEFAKACGLGQPTGINGIPEVEGVLPNPEWKQQVVGEQWYPGDSVNLSIGQGYLEATPLQVANLYAALARGGSLRSPLLVRNVTSPKGAVLENFPSEEKGNIPASPASFAAVREGMRRVTQPGGTASSAFRDFPVPVAAKTGAAENQDANTHAWFASYAPVDDPRVVVLVMVERGGFGGMVSAPVARKVLEGALSLVT